MLQEGWTQESLTFIERAKGTVQDNIVDFFAYEMEILNHDSLISN